MTTLEEQLARATARLEQHKLAMLRDVRAKYPALQCLNDEQLEQLYGMYVAAGFSDSYLPDRATQRTFVEWATTAPIRAVYLDDREKHHAFEK